jgi:hypothetical protein
MHASARMYINARPLYIIVLQQWEAVTAQDQPPPIDHIIFLLPRLSLINAPLKNHLSV